MEIIRQARAIAGATPYKTITERQMSHAVAVQDITPATKPAKTIDELIVEGIAELTVVRAIASNNAVLARFGVEYRVPIDDARLNDVAANLAKAVHAEQSIELEAADLQKTIAFAEERLESLYRQIGRLIGGDRTSDDLDQFEIRRVIALRCEADDLRWIAIDARKKLEQIDAGAAAADVARCTAELNRAEHSILMEILAGHVDRAEHALLDAVAALREVARIGTKHLGPDVGAGYIPNPRIVALLAG
jgi:hypothetical protein